MSPWVDFREIKQSVGIEQVLAVYRLQLKRVRRNYLRGRCPLPTHRSARSQQSFGVDTAKHVDAEWVAMFSIWLAFWKGARFEMRRCGCRLGAPRQVPSAFMTNWF